MLEWTDRAWKDSDEIRVGLEFVIPGQEVQYREVYRFFYDLTENKWKLPVQSLKEFNFTIHSDDKVEGEFRQDWIYFYGRYPFDNQHFDNSGTNGVELNEGKSLVDKDTKTINIEFDRPLDVSSDYSFYLVPDTEYKVYVYWGIFESKTEDSPRRIKGMIERMSEEPTFPKVDKSQIWKLPKPPGWDELQEKLASYKPETTGSYRGLSAMVAYAIMCLVAIV